jgi:peptide/nickel transport system substrate-binding protein
MTRRSITKERLMRLARLTVLAACAATFLSALVASSVSAAGTPQTFAYVTPTQVMISWDPSAGYSNEIIAMSDMYQTLTHYNTATKKAEPELAQSFKSNKAATVWTFHLRHGVTFHTGRPLTAQAAKAAIERTIHLKQGAAYIWDPVKSISTPSTYTLVFHLKYPAPLDLNASADYSAYIFDTKAAPAGTSLGAWFAQGHDSGTGPYTVDYWHKGQEVELRLKQYPQYWGGWQGSHYQAVEYWVVPSVTTAAQLQRAGKVTFVERLNPQLWASFKSSSTVQTTAAPSWQNLLALLNTKSGPLANKTVRQAISYAIDYNGIIAALKGDAVRQVGVVPPGLWGHFNALPGEYSTNLAKATSMLKSAGYGPGGKKMSLVLTHVPGDSDEDLVSTLIKSELAPLNVDVQIESMAWPTQWAKAKSSNLSQRQDIFLFYWWPDYADPFSWFVNIFKTEKTPFYNLAYYSNPTLDKQMGQAEQLAAPNRTKAISLYKTMQSTLLRDAAVIPLYVQQYQRTLQKGVSGYVDNPAYPNVVYVYDLKPAA